MWIQASFPLELFLSAILLFSAILSSNCQVNNKHGKGHEPVSETLPNLKCHICADCFDIPEAPNLPLTLTQDISFIQEEFGGCSPASTAIPVTQALQKFAQAGYPSVKDEKIIAMSSSIFCTNMSIVFGTSTVVIRSLQMIHTKPPSSESSCTSDLRTSNQTSVLKALKDLEASASRLNLQFSFSACHCQDSDGCNSNAVDCDDASRAYGTLVAQSMSTVFWLIVSVNFLRHF